MASHDVRQVHDVHDVQGVRPRLRMARRLALGPVLFYRAVRLGRPSPCRFYPSCSAYAVEAIELHGAVRGLGYTARRLLRCRPGGAAGIDLVPIRRLKAESHV